MGLINFFKNAFSDMKKSAKAQHEVDKAEFAAAKAEAKARHQQAKAMGKKDTREALLQKERAEKIEAANKRREQAEALTENIK